MFIVFIYIKMCIANNVYCLPTTQPELFQQTKRALLIAGYIWKQSLDRDPKMPNASDWSRVGLDIELMS